MDLVIRHATESDLPSLVEILNPYILKTAITFDVEPYSTETRRPWFEHFHVTGRHQCLVAVVDSQIIAYACTAPFRPKAAYDTSVEVSVYKKQNCKIPGVGARLYERLFQQISTEDVHRAHALITLPNEASISLHRKFEFAEVGTLNEAGRKFDRYYSVYWMEKKLR